jgi:hypothetical protein
MSDFNHKHEKVTLLFYILSSSLLHLILYGLNTNFKGSNMKLNFLLQNSNFFAVTGYSHDWLY